MKMGISYSILREIPVYTGMTRRKIPVGVYPRGSGGGNDR